MNMTTELTPFTLWVDDIRKPPVGIHYLYAQSTNQAIRIIQAFMPYIDCIDIDHDAGDFVSDGGDYIKILDWMEEENISIPIHIHSMNPVGVRNMRAIIQHNGWEEV